MPVTCLSLDCPERTGGKCKMEMRCVQCQKPLVSEDYCQIPTKDAVIHILMFSCDKPECPNYGLYQRGL